MEIYRQHGVVQHKKELLDAARWLARRGTISQSELEQTIAELRFHKALEAERA